jgi:hypothetical protein
VGLAGADVGGRGPMAAEHAGGTASQPAASVGLAPALGEPGVGERVAELMGMQSWQASLVVPAAQELLNTPGGQPAALAESRRGEMRVLVPGTTRG